MMDNLCISNCVNDDAARDALISLLHKDRCVCPSCGAELSDRFGNFASGKKIKCPHCSKYYTWTTNTMFSNTKMSAGQMLLLLSLLGAGCNDGQIATLSGLSLETVRMWRYRLQEL